jgi:hypothetical protein
LLIKGKQKKIELHEKCVTEDRYRVQFHSSDIVNIAPSPYILFCRHNCGGEPYAQRYI